MKKVLFILLILLLILSFGFNIVSVNHINQLKKERAKFSGKIVFQNANSRETYFSIHNVRKAHEISTGKGIKVGLLDQYFGFQKHPELYTGGKDFSGNTSSFLQIDEHGYWMALVLKEIAPDVEIYALNINLKNEDAKVENMIKAIDWAISNDIDILTYSSSRFSEENRKKLDKAVEKAIENNIVTTFIHYANKKNILPDGLSEYKGAQDYNRREPDVNIFHYDYNVLFLDRYFEHKNKTKDELRNLLYTSISSTSPVTAGFVALLKSINNNLKPSEYKQILMRTGKKMNYNGEICPRVVDIYEALQFIKENKNN